VLGWQLAFGAGDMSSRLLLLGWQFGDRMGKVGCLRVNLGGLADAVLGFWVSRGDCAGVLGWWLGVRTGGLVGCGCRCGHWIQSGHCDSLQVSGGRVCVVFQPGYPQEGVPWVLLEGSWPGAFNILAGAAP